MMTVTARSPRPRVAIQPSRITGQVMGTGSDRRQIQIALARMLNAAAIAQPSVTRTSVNPMNAAPAATASR